MKQILLLTDFSKNAYCALHYATQLFAEEKCTFIILHSFKNQVTNLTSKIDIGKTEAVVDELYNTYEVKCNEVQHKINLDTNNDKHSYKTIATKLSLPRAMNKLIKKEQIDFVVIGSKGRTGSSDFLTGSKTLAMIQKIKKAPLLVIPLDSKFKPIEKIAFATGFKREFAKNELQPLLEVASINDTDIKVINAPKKEKLTNDQRTNFHQLFEILEQSNPENNWLQEETNTYNAITSFLKKEKTDLLAMIYYKHNALKRLFREATVKDIAKHTGIPFLIMPTQN